MLIGNVAINNYKYTKIPRAKDQESFGILDVKKPSKW